MKKKRIVFGILFLFLLAGAATGWYRWKRAQILVATENAYVKGDVYAVSSKVPGTLTEVPVSNNEEIQEGAIIALLDPRDFDAAIVKAEAKVRQYEAAAEANRAAVVLARARVEASKRELDLAEIERNRISALYKRHSIPKQKYDQAVTAAEVAEVRLTADRRAVSLQEAKLPLEESRRAEAKAGLEIARLQRTYCTITAPVSGVVSRCSAEPGQVVAPGQPLCAVVPLDPSVLYVEANYKETQLKNVRPGQNAVVRVDVDPSREIRGTVESISAGTGAAFSLLPAENATGNWVKVVQRVPVKIRIDPADDPGHLLRLGLSVRVVIDTRETSSHAG